MKRYWSRLQGIELIALRHAPLIFFGLVFVGFSLLADGFLSLQNLGNIVTQSASTGILAVGMTFVLLIGRVDLSVGAIMFLCSATCGKLLEAGTPIPIALAAMVATAIAFGAVNFWFITGFRVVSFIVTLGTLYVGRGLGHWMTQTRPTPVPPFEALGSWQVVGLGLPTLLLIAVVAAAHLTLQYTQFGKQLYALGSDPDTARRAGIRTGVLVASAFLISALCSCLAAAVALTQSPTVSPEFGSGLEFTAIAAAVLGGISLFGGKGKVFPGAVLGALLLQMVANGLNIRNVDPYLYPIILGTIIFLAVLTDSQRNRKLARLARPRIRLDQSPLQDTI